MELVWNWLDLAWAGYNSYGLLRIVMELAWNWLELDHIAYNSYGILGIVDDSAQFEPV